MGNDISLRIIDPAETDIDDRVPGDMWRLYDSDTETRECWMIQLPGEHTFWYTTLKDHTGTMWSVTGEPPNITVRPSIQVAGGWHGFITDGELVTI